MHLQFFFSILEHVFNGIDKRKHPLGTVSKIVYFGLFLNDPEVTQIFNTDRAFDYLAANSSRLVDETLVHRPVRYATIERVAPKLQASFLKRFAGLSQICVNKRVQDVQRFLDFLKKFDNIVTLTFTRSDQPQDLYDRLPEHCAVESLEIIRIVQDFDFLFRLKSLTHLYVSQSVPSSLKKFWIILNLFRSLSIFSY